MAGGVWYLRDWNDWIDNPELGRVIFQFGTRPLLTQESPIPQGWKAQTDSASIRRRQSFSIASRRPASTRRAVRNPFLRQPGGTIGAADRRSPTQTAGDHHFSARRGRQGQELLGHPRRPDARARMVWGWALPDALKTPDNTLVFVTPAEKGDDPQGSGRLHGLPQPVPASRRGRTATTNSTGRLGRPAQFLHPEDVAGHRARWPDRRESDVRRPCRLSISSSDPFYSNGFVPSGEAARRPHPDRGLSG